MKGLEKELTLGKRTNIGQENLSKRVLVVIHGLTYFVIKYIYDWFILIYIFTHLLKLAARQRLAVFFSYF